MNYANETATMEAPVASTAPLSAILDEMDAVLNDCLSALDKMVVHICGTTPLEAMKADPKCMRDCVMLTADKARMVRSGIMHLVEAIGV